MRLAMSTKYKHCPTKRFGIAMPFGIFPQTNLDTGLKQGHADCNRNTASVRNAQHTRRKTDEVAELAGAYKQRRQARSR